MSAERSTALGVAMLRVSLGAMYLAHSIILKFYTFGLSATAEYYRTIGLPGWLAYGTFAAEAVGGACLVLGIQARWVALALTPALLGAIVWAHGRNGWVFTAVGGGWEYPLYLIVVSLAQFVLGDGAFALVRSSPRSAATA